MVRLPQVLWAQQSDRLFLTIDLQDSKDPQIKLNNNSEKKCGTVFFDGAAKSTATGPELHEYKLDLELFGEVDADESKISRKDRSVVLVIAKKEQGHWDRLLKTTARMPNIKVRKALFDSHEALHPIATRQAFCFKTHVLKSGRHVNNLSAQSCLLDMHL